MTHTSRDADSEGPTDRKTHREYRSVELELALETDEEWMYGELSGEGAVESLAIRKSDVPGKPVRVRFVIEMDIED